MHQAICACAAAILMHILPAAHYAVPHNCGTHKIFWLNLLKLKV